MGDVDRVTVRSAGVAEAVRAAGLEAVEHGQAVVAAPEDVVALAPTKNGPPLIVVTEAPLPVGVAARLLRLGANTVLTAAQLKRFSLASPEATLTERFLAWTSRNQFSGTVRVLAGSPLEGTATFDAGLLVSAGFCWMDGAQALEEMLGMEDAELSVEVAARPAASRQPCRVLLAEDDDAIRELLTRHLERDGYQVVQAPDGVAALGLVERFPVDAVVSDIDMPRLDGWGLLRTLRAEHATREIPVVLLSAYEDAVMTLRAAKSGARAYLTKTGRSRELLDALALLTAPRRAVREALAARRELSVELTSVGAHWLLSTLGELEAAGRAELEDELGRYEVEVAQGRLARAVAQNGSLRVEGVAALEALVTSRASGRFLPMPIECAADAPDVFAALADVQKGLLRYAAARVHALVLSPRRLEVNEELANLYGRAATPSELRVLGALRARPSTLSEVAAAAELEERHAERIVAELLKRGVVAEPRGE